MNQQLKELLKQPIKVWGCTLADDAKRVKIELVLETADRIFPVQSISLIKDFIEQSFSEKYERGFGEPMRWLRTEHGCECPSCPETFFSEAEAAVYRHCPYCGRKLRPPEEKA